MKGDIRIVKGEIESTTELPGFLEGKSKKFRNIYILLKKVLETKRLNQLFRDFHKMMGVPVAIIDLEANVLASSSWMRLCTDFHRINASTCALCIESDIELANQLKQGSQFTMYKCKNGLTDCASPIVIEGEHIANLFIGQFLLNQPDKKFFRKQAEKYGFPLKEYMDALDESPVLDEAKAQTIMDFLVHFANLVASMGLEELNAQQFSNQLEQRVSERTIELKNANEKLYENEMKNMAMLNNLLIGFSIYSADSSVIFCNKAGADIMGLTHEQMLGKKVIEPEWTFYNEDLSIMQVEDYPVSKVLSTKKPYNDLIIGFKRVDQESIKWILVNAIPVFSDENNIQKVAVNFIDITKHLKAENVITKFFEQPMNLHLISGIDGVIQRVNVGWETILGYSKNELEGRSFMELVHPDDVAATTEEIAKLEKGITTFYFENRYLHKNGSYRLLAWSALVSSEDQMIHSVASDITDKKALENQLQQAQKMESIGTLAGGIAHDFNNLLTGLFGNIELARLQLPSEHASYRYINTAYKALDNATSLTKQLLTFAKGGDPIIEKINIAQIIKESIKFSLSGSNIKTILNLPDNLWLVKADKGQLSQVITNLSINAVQAMPKGGVLTIDAENINAIQSSYTPNLSGEFVKLSICDQGIGISEEHSEHIFDPYFSTKESGRGLGLATVHSIIIKHKGLISVDSKLGTGTTFTIYIPADKSSIQICTEAPLNEAESSTATSGNILVMDDNDMILDLATEMLISSGYIVDTAFDGKDAIEKYVNASKNNRSFDVVIMDLTIPGGMGGKEAAQELLAYDPAAKIIVSSGYSSDPIMANYTKYGFKGRLAKPFQLNELNDEISKLIK